MKKLIVLLLCFCLALVCSVSVFADTDKLQIEFQNTECVKGERFTVVAVVKNNPGFCYLKMNFSYDSNLFTLVKAENGSVSADGFTVSDSAIVWDTAVDAVECGTLVTLTFEPKTDIEGNYTIVMNAVECFNYDELDVATDIKSGNVTLIEEKTPEIKAYLYGDVDNDNKVSASDARLALRYSVGLEKFNELQILIADTDNDKKISASDARMILRASVGLEELGTVTI